MPRINWNDVEERAGEGGGFKTLPGGAYECVVTAASYETSQSGNPYLDVVFDVAAGEHEGFFSTPFYQGKPFRHHDRLMLAGNGLGYTKHKLRCLAEANPGFQPSAVIEADQSRPFLGRRCFLLLQERLYTFNGRDYSEVSVARWLSPEEYRAGSYTVPDVRDDRAAAPAPVQAPTPAAAPAPVQAPAPAPAPAVELADADIPF